MNKIIKISIAIILAFVSLNTTMAQTDSLFVTPTYTLKVTNVTVTTDGTTFEWDVYMLQTNPEATPFIYGAAQYFLNFNTAIALPGDSLRYSIIASDLPSQFRPVNASISGNILRLASNLPTLPEDSPIISSVAPGTKVLRMRFKNFTRPFQAVPLGLAWRSELPNPFTKIAAFTGEDNTVLVDISTPATHTVDIITGIGNGTTPTAVQIPTEYNLSQNFPNPFNPTTKIDYSISVEGKVNIVVYDIVGREVMNLVNSVQTAGFYSVNFNGANLASGMYFYRINVTGESDNNFRATKRMVLIK